MPHFYGATFDTIRFKILNLSNTYFLFIFPSKKSAWVNTTTIDFKIIYMSIFKDKFFKQNLNTNHSMLVEEIVDGYAVGYTENYVYTYLKGKHKVGDIVKVKLTENYKLGMLAEIVD